MVNMDNVAKAVVLVFLIKIAYQDELKSEDTVDRHPVMKSGIDQAHSLSAPSSTIAHKSLNNGENANSEDEPKYRNQTQSNDSGAVVDLSEDGGSGFEANVDGPFSTSLREVGSGIEIDTLDDDNNQFNITTDLISEDNDDSALNFTSTVSGADARDKYYDELGNTSTSSAVFTSTQTTFSDTTSVGTIVPSPHNVCQEQSFESLAPEEKTNLTRIIVRTDKNHSAIMPRLCEVLFEVLLVNLVTYEKRARRAIVQVNDFVRGKDIAVTFVGGYKPTLNPNEFSTDVLVHDSNGAVVPGTRVHDIVVKNLEPIKEKMKREGKTFALSVPLLTEAAGKFTDPILVPVLVAVVIAVFVIAVLSAVILIMWQVRRKKHHGEWVVNEKPPVDDDSWCFDNKGFANQSDLSRGSIRSDLYTTPTPRSYIPAVPLSAPPPLDVYQGSDRYGSSKASPSTFKGGGDDGYKGSSPNGYEHWVVPQEQMIEMTERGDSRTDMLAGVPYPPSSHAGSEVACAVVTPSGDSCVIDSSPPINSATLNRAFLA